MRSRSSGTAASRPRALQGRIGRFKWPLAFRTRVEASMRGGRASASGVTTPPFEISFYIGVDALRSISSQPQCGEAGLPQGLRRQSGADPESGVEDVRETSPEVFTVLDGTGRLTGEGVSQRDLLRAEGISIVLRPLQPARELVMGCRLPGLGAAVLRHIPQPTARHGSLVCLWDVLRA